MKTIRINGIEYKQIEKEVRKPSKAGIMLFGFMMIVGGGMLGKSKKHRSNSQIDIVKEYGLIQVKKSTLSANQREWVKSRFHDNFIKI